MLIFKLDCLRPHSARMVKYSIIRSISPIHCYLRSNERILQTVLASSFTENPWVLLLIPITPFSYPNALSCLIPLQNMLLAVSLISISFHFISFQFIYLKCLPMNFFQYVWRIRLRAFMSLRLYAIRECHVIIFIDNLKHCADDDMCFNTYNSDANTTLISTKKTKKSSSKPKSTKNRTNLCAFIHCLVSFGFELDFLVPRAQITWTWKPLALLYVWVVCLCVWGSIKYPEWSDSSNILHLSPIS